MEAYMKKIFLILIVFLSINLSANAYYQVNYNSAGGVTSTSSTVPTPFGMQTYVNNYSTSDQSGYGSNALFNPNTTRKLAEQQRRIQNEKTYLENTKNINVNVNYTGFYPYRYNNGYYNRNYYSNYPNYGGVRYNRGRGYIIY